MIGVAQPPEGPFELTKLTSWTIYASFERHKSTLIVSQYSWDQKCKLLYCLSSMYHRNKKGEIEKHKMKKITINKNVGNKTWKNNVKCKYKKYKSIYTNIHFLILNMYKY